MTTITIGCRLPSGLTLDLGDASKPPVVIYGQRQAQERSKIITLSDEDCGYTEVDADFWEEFKRRVGPEFAPIKSGAVFEAKNTKEAEAKQKDLKSKKTGHEPVGQDEAGIKAA